MAPQKRSRERTLELDAGNAAIVDIGKMLGPTGINTRQVKLDYDAATAGRRGDVVPVVVTVFEDHSFALRYKTPPTSYLVRKVLGLAAGSPKPGSRVVAKMSRRQLREVAERKLPDRTTGPSIPRCGTARRCCRPRSPTCARCCRTSAAPRGG